MKAKAEKVPGRPTKYRPEYCRHAALACKLGATDEELADLFGINPTTLYRWQQAHPELREAIRAGKLVADIVIAGKLYDKAIGFHYEEALPIKLKEVKFASNGRKISAVERIEIVKVRRVVPPDTVAAMFWLTNRQQDKWKNHVSAVRTGEGGGALQVENVTSGNEREAEDVPAPS